MTWIINGALFAIGFVCTQAVIRTVTTVIFKRTILAR